jgi:thiosulfate reductase cytochrome b subunit
VNRIRIARSLFLGGIALILIGAALFLSNRSAMAGGAPAAAAAESLHPDFAFLDRDGENVLVSGLPVSTMRTCGQCHDTEFIAGHSFHADAGLADFGTSERSGAGHSWDQSPGIFGDWNPIVYRYLSPGGDALVDLTTPEWLMTAGIGHVGGGPAETARDGRPLFDLAPGSSPEAAVLDPGTGAVLPWDWAASGVVEMNCFICHISEPDLPARAGALASGNFGWANTATLGLTGIVANGADGPVYLSEAFADDGVLIQSNLGLQAPTNRNCGACHGVVHTNPDIPLDDAGITAWRTSTTGQIISPQRISDSGLNIAGKADLDRSWDVHAERVVACTDCHFSLNNPVYSDGSPQDDLGHLVFDPRRLDISAYLLRPDHDFARGASGLDAVPPEQTGAMRRCESCHDSGVSHSWLPYTDRHMAALSCETCHIPNLYAPAIESVDRTVLTAAGGPVIRYRGIADPESETPLLTGFEPVLLPAADVDADGKIRFTPFNLVSAWYWVYTSDSETRPVRQIDLEAAWLEGGGYAVEILAVFDLDKNGDLEPAELIIDTDEKEALIGARLAELGLADPRIAGEVQPYPIHHDVTGGEWATRDCSACHAADSRLGRPVVLSGYVPGGVEPVFAAAGPDLAPGTMAVDANGALTFTPDPSGQGFYLLGHDRVGWIDGLGISLFAAVLIGVTVHGGLRYVNARRKAGQAHAPEIREVYMYTSYERFWHWLQTASILVLLFTGLIIHKPDTFGVFSFRHVVLVHNVLAAILVLNAALSLFYHLVSGEIRQYLPRPRGFFDDAVRQTKFYLQGIFRGEAHPFDRSPDHKLNPLQQVTYFGILNVLLPLQVLTGILMWGAQRWPELAARFGGLAFLGPFHSLVAWTFAAFIVGHVYLTTTGPYPTAAIKAMMVGWDEIEVHPGSEPAIDRT